MFSVCLTKFTTIGDAFDQTRLDFCSLKRFDYDNEINEIPCNSIQGQPNNNSYMKFICREKGVFRPPARAQTATKFV